jgi:hypothetical protein
LHGWVLDSGRWDVAGMSAPVRQLNVFELFVKALFESTALLKALQTCADDPSATASSANYLAGSAKGAV